MSLRLWLLGEGIAGSPSPAMQDAALAAAGIEGGYELRECTRDGLAAALAALRRGEAQGANVTTPHKHAAASACDRLEGDARRLGAVNTLIVEGGDLVGVNTDARGLELALAEEGIAPLAGPAVVLGAGGAAAAAVLGLLRVGSASVTIAARRSDRAAALAARFDARVGALALDDPGIAGRLGAAALVLNATPAGLPALPVDPDRLGAAAVVVDLRYRPRPVDLVAATRASGRQAVDGTSMLLHQGMLAFERWTQRRPPLEAARRALLAALGDPG
ncbi:MAG TPA: shikimate dehydrogenase [Candidatus Dormibacteraeota bacterium]